MANITIKKKNPTLYTQMTTVNRRFDVFFRIRSDSFISILGVGLGKYSL